MFEEIIEIQKNRILQLFENNYLTNIGEINNCNDIPNWVKTYFNSNIYLEIYKLENDISAKEFIDLSIDEIGKSWQAFEDSLKTQAKIDLQIIEKWVDEAIHLYINYLIRPRFTLTNFIFKEDDELSIEKIKQKLIFFNEYQYLKDGIYDYINNYESNYNFNRKNFYQAIANIDDNYFRNKSVDEIADIFDPLCNFFNINNYDYKFLPIAALKIYFNDKSWASIENALLKIQRKTNAILWTKSQIIEFLKNYENIDFENATNNQIPLFNGN
ncbi:MAG TPA: hypothetical protein PKV40_04295 [Candidatus Kapabacteria bacterium]|nr:hypothetical protein [Candidatus Kapabacteria bacterium]